MSEPIDDFEAGVDASEQLDQLSQSDSLIDRGVDDALDEGYTPPDHWSPAQGFGNTAVEMRRGETIEQLVAQELPETDPNRLQGPWNPTRESREVGSVRAGRLVATDSGKTTDTEAVANDVGIDGAAASAEEAAMHIIDENDLSRPGADDGDELDEQ